MAFWRGVLVAGMVAVAMLESGASVWAADDFDTQLRAAQARYRAALYATRDAGQPDAVTAVTGYTEALRQVLARFPAPPMRFENDSQWAGSLEEIVGLSEEADRAVRSGDVISAHDHLELIRKLIRDLRRRNGVLVYSDIVSTYHIEVESILMGGYTLAAFDRPDTFGRLREQVGVLEHIVARLERDAPFTTVVHPDFRAAVDGLYLSIDTLRSAVAKRDKKATLKAMDGLLPAYWAFFLKFG